MESSERDGEGHGDLTHEGGATQTFKAAGQHVKGSIRDPAGKASARTLLEWGLDLGYVSAWGGAAVLRTLTGYDLIIFDCDGVLVDSELLAIQAMRDVLNAAGVPVTEAMILRCFGMKQVDTLRRIAEETGREIPHGVAERLWPATRSAFEASLEAMPGIFGVLDRMNGPRCCVASSSHPERIATSLALTGLAGYFGGGVFSSHQVSRGKPAPDLFLFAAASMGVDPARCAVVEDSVFGIEGAGAAGMTAYGFIGGAHIQAGHGDSLRQSGAVAVEATWDAMARRLLG